MSDEEMACELPFADVTSDEISEVLANSRTIAVVGLSPKAERASNAVAKYLIEQGYRIYPVNPMHEEILGMKSYPNLKDVPDDVDVVDIFRRSGEVPDIVSDAIEKGAKTIWMQEGVINNAAAKIAKEAGMIVVMDRCMMKEHRRWKINEGSRG